MLLGLLFHWHVCGRPQLLWIGGLLAIHFSKSGPIENGCVARGIGRLRVVWLYLGKHVVYHLVHSLG